MTLHTSRTYLPAAGHDWLLPLYDPIVKLLGGEKTKRALLEESALRPGSRVLDLGCGTGTFAIMIKRLHPDVEVVGVDPDSKALVRARRKATRARVHVQFDQAFGDELPYPQGTFDRVFSTFMFHHIPSDEKDKVLRSVRRVLKPGGEFHMLDFEAGPGSAHGLLGRFFHPGERLKDNSESKVLGLMNQSGFADARKVRRGMTLFGSVAHYRAHI